MAPSGPLSRIRVVLVEPSHPGNIGAAARAMRTMGLSRLALVRPRLFPHPDAVALASGATGVLEQARVCATLAEALAGTALSVALSARGRDLSHPVQDARAAAAEVVRVATDAEAALVFGNETAGLSNEDVLRCSRLATVPSDPECSSLNLAQAVQVLAYEVRMAAVRWSPSRERVPDYASHEEVENFYAHLEASVVRSGFLDPKAPRRLIERLRRMFGRARLEREEVNILRGMLTSWDEGPHAGPRAPKRDPGKNS
jgi:tRNA/rRNA methyltransferase